MEKKNSCFSDFVTRLLKLVTPSKVGSDSERIAKHSR